MVICPACHAENPDGTKICVKCGTELPKAVPAKKGAEAAAAKGFEAKDLGRDMLDIVWLLLIVVLIFLGFLFQATNGTFRLTDQEEAKIVQPIKMVMAVHPVHHKHSAVSHERTKAAPEEAAQPEAPAATMAPAIEEQPEVQFGSAETFYQKGKKQYDQKKYQASYKSLRQALEIDPTYAKAYFGLGYLYSRFDMNDAAVRMYEMALRFDPNHVDSINNLAMMYYHAGNDDDALELLQKAVQLDASNADCQYNLGSLYLDRNEPNEALDAFQKASVVRPTDASIYNNMALAYEKMGNKQQALDTWNKVLMYAQDAELIRQAKTHLDFLQTQG